MIELYLYGDVKKLVSSSIPDVNTILIFDYVEGEDFKELLNRLGLKPKDVGECYINNTLADPKNLIHDGDTIELNQHKHST